MKLVMTLLVRDEQDIIRENIEFHLAQGVDFFIATDNRSVDTTAEILQEYEARGLLHYIFEGSDDYNQHAWVTKMAQIAHTRFHADWVINNDADEFWWPLEGTLKDVFMRLPDDINIVSAKRHNFIMTGDPEKPFWMRMVYRYKQSLNPMGNPLPPKIAHRGLPNIRVKQGNHSVSGFESQKAEHKVIEILHYPVRSLSQIENKISKGGAAYEKNQELSKDVGITWRKLYEQYKTDSNLIAYFDEQYHDSESVKEAVKHGTLMQDLRLYNELKALFSANRLES